MANESPLRQNEIFTDIMSSGGRNPLTGDLAIVRNADSVEESLRNLLLTERFERPSRPGLGTNLRSLLYELMNPALGQMANVAVREAFALEPRAEFPPGGEVEVYPDPDNNKLAIRIPYVYVNNDESRVLDVIVERTDI